MLLFENLVLKWTDFGSARINKIDEESEVNPFGISSSLYCSPEILGGIKKINLGSSV